MNVKDSLAGLGGFLIMGALLGGDLAIAGSRLPHLELVNVVGVSGRAHLTFTVRDTAV
jgi:hypothetical protein